MKIVIDPGHGAPDSGAIGPHGTREADINLSVGIALSKELCRRGHVASLTRSGPRRLIADNRGADLSARPAFSNRIGADCFVSLHCNGAANAAANGFEIYTTIGQDRSDALATEIFRAWSNVFSTQRKRTDYADGDPDKEANLRVLRECHAPAVLVEMAFISNPVEEQWLRNPTNHREVAAAISEGIERWAKMYGSSRHDSDA